MNPKPSGSSGGRTAAPAPPTKPPTKPSSTIHPGFSIDRGPHKFTPNTKATGAPEAQSGRHKSTPHTSTPKPDSPTDPTTDPTGSSPTTSQATPPPSSTPPNQPLDDPHPSPTPTPRDPISKADHDRVGQAIDDILRDHGFKPYSGPAGHREAYGFSIWTGDQQGLAKDVASGKLGSRSTGDPVLDAQILDELRQQLANIKQATGGGLGPSILAPFNTDPDQNAIPGGADITPLLPKPTTPTASDELFDRTLAAAQAPQVVDHVFNNPGHLLDDFVTAHGGQQEAMKAIVRGLLSGTIATGGDGQFEVQRTIDGVTITIRGRIVDGTPRIGTAFVPR